jgi:hypothetical protein
VTTIHVTYLGEGELAGIDMELRASLKQWPVALPPMKRRSLPKEWGAERVALAAYNAEAVRALVVLAREMRGERRGRKRAVGINLVCSEERAEMLTKMFAIDSNKRVGELLISVERCPVHVRVRYLDGRERDERTARERRTAALAVADEYEVWLGHDRLVCHVAPRVVARPEAELYSVLRGEGMAIDEAMGLVETLRMAPLST